MFSTTIKLYIFRITVFYLFFATVSMVVNEARTASDNSENGMGLAADIGVLLFSLIKILFQTIAGWVTPTRYKSVEADVCLITGAANGIGRLMAVEFAKRKASMVLWDIDEKGLRETERLVQEAGAPVKVYICDVSDRESIKKCAEKTREDVGDVTILVNNAGVVYCKELLQLSDQQIEQTFKVNTLAPFWTLREFLPYMLDTNHGHIVTIASTVGLFASPGMPDYCSSKHAAVGFHQSIYFDLQNAGKRGIKTTLVCPYLITTGMFKEVNVDRNSLLPPLSPEECVERIMHAVLSNRLFVAIPRTMYLSYYLTTVLPMEALYATYKFTGAHRAITKFIPNRPYQVEAYTNN